MRTTAPTRIATLLLAVAASASAATTINEPNQYAWGANVGWINWQGDVTNGAVIGEYVCSGYLWTANAGWIHLGDGEPADSVRYGNTDGSDCGVNVVVDEATGDVALRGLAWGANVGWVNFEATGNPRIDCATGEFRGYAWSANCGWINLGDATFAVRTDTIAMGDDSDGDGIADAFELLHGGNLALMNETTDLDHDGQLDAAEYTADTDPADAAAALRIVHFFTPDSGTTTELAWTSRPTRRYRIETKLTLSDEWEIAVPGIVPDPGATTSLTLDDAAAGQRFYRIRAIRPLAP